MADTKSTTTAPQPPKIITEGRITEEASDRVAIGWKLYEEFVCPKLADDYSLKFKVTYKNINWPNDIYCSELLDCRHSQYIIDDETILANSKYDICVHALTPISRDLTDSLRSRRRRPRVNKLLKSKRAEPDDRFLACPSFFTNGTRKYQPIDRHCEIAETPKWIGHFAWAGLLAALLIFLFLCCCVMLSRWCYKKRRNETRKKKYMEALNGVPTYPVVNEDEIVRIFRNPQSAPPKPKPERHSFYDDSSLWPRLPEPEPEPVIEVTAKVKSYATLEFPKKEVVREKPPTPPPPKKEKLRFIYTEDPLVFNQFREVEEHRGNDSRSGGGKEQS